MKKVIAFAVVAVLVVGSSAIAQINLQGQDWNLGLTNNLMVIGGPSDASTIQGIGALNVQTMGINPDGNGGFAAESSQGIGAALFQTGETETGGAKVSLDQGLTILGFKDTAGNGPGQIQQLGDLAGPAREYQGVRLDGHNTLDKAVGSAGEASGLNIAAFGMAQEVENNCADGGQLSLILGGQASSLEGQAQAIGHVATTMWAQVTQIQVANTPVTAP
jgi:hypothetical protein